jgi:hypothetical protein
MPVFDPSQPFFSSDLALLVFRAMRSPYDAERLVAVAATATAEEAKTIPPEAANVSVTCRFAGVMNAAGLVDPNKTPTAKAPVAFEWVASAEGRELCRTMVQLRADDAVAKRKGGGVPFPSAWRVALRCCGIPDICASSSRSLGMKLGMSRLLCDFLGKAKDSSLEQVDGMVPGAEALLMRDGELKKHILCARVHGDFWLVYAASAHTPSFDPQDLSTRVVFPRDLQPAASQPVPKRGRKAVSLRAAAALKPTAWSLLCAVAAYKAEEQRAAKRGCFFRDEVACALFEPDPWRWDDDSKIEVTVCWSWHREAGVQRQLVTCRLDNIFQRKVVNGPPLLDVDGYLFAQLLTVATRETDLRKAPCVYLGAKVGDSFEPDPSKWSVRACCAVGGKAKIEIFFEWTGVRCNGQPHRVSARVQSVLDGSRRVPHHPLSVGSPRGLLFDTSFATALATNVRDGIIFKGISFDTSPDIVLQMPKGGLDCQDEDVFWVLPGGASLCMSLRALAEAREDELVSGDADEAYRAVAEQIDADVLGTASESDLAALRQDPGTLADRRWEEAVWSLPADETTPCWWLVNPTDVPTKVPRFLCRSLVVLRLELKNSRCATSDKLRSEWERRVEDNACAAAILEANPRVWAHAGGPDPASLRMPTEEAVHAARRAAAALQVLAEKSEGCGGSLVTQVCEAAGRLKVASWDAIRRERFSLTPIALYGELARNADVLLQRLAGDAERRRTRLAATVQDTVQDTGEAEAPRGPCVDKYGLDLDEFKKPSSRKPHGWQDGLRQAYEVVLDEMRALLELHYDAVHEARWRATHAAKKMPTRRSEHSLYKQVATMHRRKLNVRLALPDCVKELFQSPADETRWERLEELRWAVVEIVQGIESATLTSGEAADLAEAVERTRTDHPCDVVRTSGPVPGGSRIILDVVLPFGASVAEQRDRVVAALRGAQNVRFHRWPFGSHYEAPISKFARALITQPRRSLQELAADHDAKSPERALDELLVVLWDALFFAQAVEWTNRGVSNLRAWETLEVARWFLRGQKVGQEPLFDGLCAMCGVLLHGDLGAHSALSNKCSSTPCDRDGKPLLRADGTQNVEAQPPFLLRWSPAVFARELPRVFRHCAETNRLSLQPEVNPPWVRQGTTDWFYCNDCLVRWLRPHGQRPQSHIPFRDRASTHFMKTVRRTGVPTTAAPEAAAPEAAVPVLEEVIAPTGCSEPVAVEQDADEKSDVSMDPVDEAVALNCEVGPPSRQPAQGCDLDGQADVEEEEEYNVPELDPLPPEAPRPTLEEYRARWAELLKEHERAVEGPFGHDNLVPTPISQLWQDCPFVPFHKLKSNEAQSRLSVCRPVSSLEEASVTDGVPRYAHHTGDVVFRRRQPLQLASTLAFVLGKKDGRFLRCSQEEADAVHECLTWARDGNNKVLTLFGTLFEAFSAACGKLLQKFVGVLPEGSRRARIRFTHKETRRICEDNLDTTLGEEAEGIFICVQAMSGASAATDIQSALLRKPSVFFVCAKASWSLTWEGSL